MLPYLLTKSSQGGGDHSLCTLRSFRKLIMAVVIPTRPTWYHSVVNFGYPNIFLLSRWTTSSRGCGFLTEVFVTNYLNVSYIFSLYNHSVQRSVISCIQHSLFAAYDFIDRVCVCVLTLLCARPLSQCMRSVTLLQTATAWSPAPSAISGTMSLNHDDSGSHEETTDSFWEVRV